MAEFTSEQSMKIEQARHEFERTGFPEKAQRLELLVEEGASFKEIDALITSKGQTTTEQPPLSGKGSGTEAWRDYAKEVSDLDDEVIDDMSKEDLVEALKAQGIVEGE